MLLDFTEAEELYFRRIADKAFKRKSTENLLLFPDFEIKKELFGANLFFKDLVSFIEFIDEDLPYLLSKHKFIFRGMQEASHRLFNKAQRRFRDNALTKTKNNKDFHDIIIKMIDKAKLLQHGLLIDYFKSFGGKENDVAILSFLQHFGAPTPLLDWTYDFFVALFFATQNIRNADFATPSSKNDVETISDYFSIYLMREDMPKYMISKYNSLSIHTKKGNTYSTLMKKDIAYVNEIYHSGRPKFYLLNNLNILSQKGIFIYNNSAHLPLEEVLFKGSLMYYLFRSPKDETVLRSPLLCLNIHKSLAKFIRKDLRVNGYTKSSIFPNAKLLSKQSTPKELL